MKNWVSHILTVQKLDMRMHSLEVKYRTIPAERERLQSGIEEAAALASAANAQIKKIELAVKNDQSAAGELEAKIRKLQIQSTTTKKNDQYQAIMNEIASVHAKISEIETDELGLYDQLEEAKKEFASADAARIAAERSAKIENEELAVLAGQLKEEALKVKKERRDYSALCDRSVLEAYLRLREKDRSAPCVVPLKNGACANCALKITPQTLNEAKKGLLTICDNCGSILYDPDSPSDYQS